MQRPRGSGRSTGEVQELVVSLRTRGARGETLRGPLPLPRRFSGSTIPTMPTAQGCQEKRKFSLLSPLNLLLRLKKEHPTLRARDTLSPVERRSASLPPCTRCQGPSWEHHAAQGSGPGLSHNQGRTHFLTPVPLLLSESLKARGHQRQGHLPSSTAEHGQAALGCCGGRPRGQLWPLQSAPQPGFL